MWRVIFRVNYFLCLIQAVIPMSQRERDWGPNPTVFNIGGVLSNNESERYFNETISVSKLIFVLSLLLRVSLYTPAYLHF